MYKSSYNSNLWLPSSCCCIIVFIFSVWNFVPFKQWRLTTHYAIENFLQSVAKCYSHEYIKYLNICMMLSMSITYCFKVFQMLQKMCTFFDMFHHPPTPPGYVFRSGITELKKMNNFRSLWQRWPDLFSKGCICHWCMRFSFH